MRVINYIRLSSESQIDNQSAQIQHETNEHEIERLKESGDINPHIKSEKIDDSGVSGLLDFQDRKFGKELLNLKEGDYIFISHVDRLSRDNRIYANFVHRCKLNKVNIIAPNTGNLTMGANANQSFLSTMQAVFSEYTVKTTKQKCRSGSQKKRGYPYHDFQAVKNGMGGRVPYGYRKEGSGKNALFIRESWHEEAVDLIHNLHKKGKSYREIAATVTVAFSPYESAKLSYQTVLKIIKNSEDYESTLKINQEVM
tara:strand:+ start:149 stop:913 length:765 start_codon:yes stop_codon:yes gene_type:complete